MGGKKDKKGKKNAVVLPKLPGSMPISAALLSLDESALSEVLKPHDMVVSSVVQSDGERYTGGKSTPVYHLTLADGKCLVAKLIIVEVSMPLSPTVLRLLNVAFDTPFIS